MNYFNLLKMTVLLSGLSSGAMVMAMEEVDEKERSISSLRATGLPYTEIPWQHVKTAGGQTASYGKGHRIALTTFNNSLCMAYIDAADPSKIWVARSSDGETWPDINLSFAANVGLALGPLALAPFNNNLFMVYVLSHVSSHVSSDSYSLKVSQSSDGLNWTPLPDILGRGASDLALASFNNALYIVYTDPDPNNCQLWVNSTTDGQTWKGATQVTGHSGSSPSLAVHGLFLHLSYVDGARGNYNIWTARSEDGFQWQAGLPTRVSDRTQVIQGASALSLASVYNYLYLTYTDPIDGKLWLTRSSSSFNTPQDTQVIQGQAGHSPALAVYNGRLYMTYIDAHGSAIYQSWTNDIY